VAAFKKTGDKMTVSLWRASLAAALLGFVGIATASAAAPEAKDLGPVADHAGDQTISVTIALKLEDPAGAEAMMQHVSTPGDTLYQQFLTPERFAAQFGPSEATLPRSLRTSVTAASGSSKRARRH
jgi:hypothetical protein